MIQGRKVWFGNGKKKKKMLHKRGLKGEDESSEKQDLYRIGKNLSILR